MNTDYQDIKSYKKPNICENLCPNLTGFPYHSAYLLLILIFEIK
jgi:hypothetical protein